MPTTDPMKVSVCMTAYNQEGFISQAIEGVLMQKTSFPIELQIGDDCSTDNTGIICRDYASRFPEIVKYHRRDRNLGMMPNFLETLGACDGRYIAWCEGDDYWIDENKLQIQADLLESRDDLSLACHNHYFLTNGKLIKANVKIHDDFKVLTTEDYLLDPHFQTASYFIRRTALPEAFPGWYREVLAGDHFLVLLLSMKGNIGYFNKRMSVFRTYSTSVTGIKGPLRIKENFVHHLAAFDEETGNKFSCPINTVVNRWNLVYKVYEPVGYFQKLSYFLRNIPFYIRNFHRVGGIKLMAKYFFTAEIFDRVKSILKRV